MLGLLLKAVASKLAGNAAATAVGGAAKGAVAGGAEGVVKGAIANSSAGGMIDAATSGDMGKVGGALVDHAMQQQPDGNARKKDGLAQMASLPVQPAADAAQPAAAPRQAPAPAMAQPQFRDFNDYLKEYLG